MSEPIDPVCLIHGKRMSEHDCLYCCLCFTPLTPEQCHVREDGQKEDVCLKCAKQEKKTRFPHVIAALADLQRAHPEYAAEIDLAMKMIWGERPNIEQKYDALLLKLDRAISQMEDQRNHQIELKGEAKCLRATWQAKAKEQQLNHLLNDFKWMRARNADLIRAMERQRDKPT